MAGRATLLTARAAGELLDHIRTRDGAEPAERIIGSQLIGYTDGASAIAALQRDGVPLQWCGAAAAEAGLVGVADDKSAAMALKFGRLPTTGEPIRTAIRTIPGKDGESRERRVVYGWVLSAPKTVSLLLMHPDEAVQQAVRECLEIAADEAIRTLEASLTVRRGKRSDVSEGIRGLLGVRAPHFTSAAGDPHAHVHFVLNASAPAKSDGKWRALDSRVFFAAQRVAEAAFNDALRIAFSQRFGLDDDVWELTYVGSVPTYELRGLLPFVERFSRARANMEEIARMLGHSLGPGLTRDQDALIWRLHRRDRQAAEAVEHLLDAALIAGKEAAAAIREEWLERLGEEGRAILERYRLVTDGPELRRPTAEALVAALEGGEDTPEHASLREAATVLAVDLGRRLGPFIASDVVAHFRANGMELSEARRASAACIRYWASAGLIHLPRGLDPEVVAAAVEAGIVEDTALQHAANSHVGKIVSDDLLQRELAIDRMAAELAREHRRAIPLIDITGLSLDQVAAVQAIGRGQALTMIQGVAGAGKTTMLRPVVEAARRQGMDVLVLSRNAKLAHELGADLGVRSQTLAGFMTYTAPTTPSRPTLVIVDEGGVGDQDPWLAVLEYARRNEGVQVVGIGDRLQIQPIDRLATWAVVAAAASREGSYYELGETFRNAAWAGEAFALREMRSDDVVAVASREGRLRAVDDPAQEAAREVLEGQARGEDVLAIARTNEEVAAIADAVQEGLGVRVDERAQLRWEGQLTGVGDLVRTRDNDYVKGIHNGDTWRVVGVSDYGIRLQAVREGNQRLVWISHDWARQAVELAYAITADSAQGVTTDRSVVLADEMGRSMLYSAATRGKQAPIYLFHVIEGSTPADQLRASIERDDIAKTMREILEQSSADLQREAKQAELAQLIWQATNNATREERRPLVVDLRDLDADQARAADLMAQGRALAIVEGVADADKSRLLRPVVEAAKSADMKVVVVSEEPEAARRLRSELGIGWISLDKLKEHVEERRRLAQPTLVIADGLAGRDPEDWLAVLRLAKDKNAQVVAVGDGQATGETIRDAAKAAGALVEVAQNADPISDDERVTIMRAMAERVRKWREAKLAEEVRRQHELARQLFHHGLDHGPSRGPSRGIGL